MRAWLGWTWRLAQSRLPWGREPGPILLSTLILLLATAGAVAVEQMWLEPSRFWSGAPYTGAHRPTERWVLAVMPTGAEAPDFTLPDLTNHDPVRLANFRGHRPVVLIFGSFT